MTAIPESYKTSEEMERDKLFDLFRKGEDETKVGNRKWRRKTNAIYKYKEY